MKLRILLCFVAAMGFHSSCCVFANDGYFSASGSHRGSLVSINFDHAEVSDFEQSASDSGYAPADELQLEDISSEEAGSSASQDPQALPAVPPPHPVDPVETILQNSPSMVPAGTDFAPLHWSGLGRAPNPLADYMRQQWCVDGLWDSHPAERAAQCAKQAYRISGAWRHHCSHCNCSYCGNAGCAANCGHACGSHASCKAPLNRYLLLRQYELQAVCDGAPQNDPEVASQQ